LWSAFWRAEGNILGAFERYSEGINQDYEQDWGSDSIHNPSKKKGMKENDNFNP
jgi:hypothetical protein